MSYRLIKIAQAPAEKKTSIWDRPITQIASDSHRISSYVAWSEGRDHQERFGRGVNPIEIELVGQRDGGSLVFSVSDSKLLNILLDEPADNDFYESYGATMNRVANRMFDRFEAAFVGEFRVEGVATVGDKHARVILDDDECLLSPNRCSDPCGGGDRDPGEGFVIDVELKDLASSRCVAQRAFSFIEEKLPMIQKRCNEYEAIYHQKHLDKKFMADQAEKLRVANSVMTKLGYKLGKIVAATFKA